jgi:hypothetical protein
LRADGKAGKHRSVTKCEVHEPRHDGDLHSNCEIARSRQDGSGDDAQGDVKSRLS